MERSQSTRRLTRIQQQLWSLELKYPQFELRKKDLMRHLSSVRKQDDYIASIELNLHEQQRRQTGIQAAVELSKDRVAKLSQKLGELQGRRSNLILQQGQIATKKQMILAQAKVVYTPKISEVDEVRLELIGIENSEELADFSNIFSLRKTVIAFMKQQNHNHLTVPHLGLEVELCQRLLVDQFQIYLMNLLSQKNLIQFKMTVGEPITKYLRLLKRIETFFVQNQSNIHSEQEFNKEKGQQLIDVLVDMERSLTENQRQVERLDLKIEKTKIKKARYKEYLEQLVLQRERAVDENNQCKAMLQQLGRPSPLIRSYSSELEQITEAIQYLRAKLAMSKENSNSLNISSPKTLHIFSKYSTRLDSPLVLS